MAEHKRNFWTTVPGVISGVAAIVTGLGVLIPLLLGAAGKHPNKNTASQNPPGVSSTGTEGTTSTAGGGTSGNASPLPTDGSSPFSADSPSDSSGGLGITADPPSVSFGSIQQGKSTPDKTVTISNPGTVPVTIDKVEITGSDAAAFSITSTTCGDKSTVDPNKSCQVSLHFTPNALRSESAALVVHYYPPQSSFTTIQLSGSGSLL
jgi:hypothetical protein